MAKSTISFNLIILFVTIFFIISMAESRIFDGVFQPTTPTCNKVYGAESGDTCFDITQMFGLTTEVFESINPNLVCNRLFAGQWVCISGKPN